MIKKILHHLSVGYMQTEDRVNSIKHYMDMMQHRGWDVHLGFLVEIENAIQHYMFSEQFTNLSAEEKDIEQKVLYNFHHLMQFLVNPLKGANINSAIKKHNKKMEKGPKKQPAGK